VVWPGLSPEEVLQWVNNDRRRLLHVVYRFGDLDKTIKYDNAVLRLR
jgi:lactoylglutathione lyase